MFDEPEIIGSINQLFILLIPKVDKPELAKHFRAIKLSNVIYKLIAKIVVNKLKRIMPTIIAPTQCSFI